MPEPTRQSPPPVRRREIFGWAMFDFANSSYTTVIVTVAFSVYFTKLVAPGARADALWGFAILTANLLVLVLAPILGTVADSTGRKKWLLAGTYAACIAGTAALWLVLPGRVGLGLTLFVLSNLAYALGETVAGAFLPEISTSANIGRVSGFGWGLGYLGGLGSLFAVLPLLEGGFTTDNLEALRLAWVVTALFFLFGGLPTFLLLRERAPRGVGRSLAGYTRETLGRLSTTAHSLRHFSELARFLVIFFVFTCGLTSVISFAAIFAERSLGFSSGELIRLFLLLQISSALGAVSFGWLQDRVGPRRTIRLTLILWLAVSIGAWLCTSKALFWAIGFIAGFGIGSLQSSSRALVGLFSPLAKSGEFFGFWGMAMRAAYMVGPAVFGLVSSATGSQRTAILVNAIFFAAGLVAMGRVDEARGHAAARRWDAMAVQ